MNKIFKNYNFYSQVVILFLFLSNIILIIKNFSFAYEAINIGVSPSIALATIYDIRNTFNLATLITTVVSTLLASVSLLMLREYILLQKKVKGVKRIGIGMILAILATHCAACGTAILGGLVSVSILTALPFGGAELGMLAIIVLIYTIYDLNNKLNHPYVC